MSVAKAVLLNICFDSSGGELRVLRILENNRLSLHLYAVPVVVQLPGLVLVESRVVVPGHDGLGIVLSAGQDVEEEVFVAGTRDLFQRIGDVRLHF